MGLHYFDISTLPRRYDIVWCRFPLDGNDEPGLKLRPVLVRAAKRDTQSGRSAVVVSYGTSNLKLGQRDRIDLVIQNATQLNRLHLPKATRFDLDTMCIAPWCSEFFAVPPHAFSIVTGTLDNDQIARFNSKLRRREAVKQKAKS
jgi:hypothetical protein